MTVQKVFGHARLNQRFMTSHKPHRGNQIERITSRIAAYYTALVPIIGFFLAQSFGLLATVVSFFPQQADFSVILR